MAVSVRNMEKACDYSMRGVYLEELVKNYVETFGDEFAMMFDYIWKHQTKVYDTYGDADESVTKLETTGDVVEKSIFNDQYTYSVRAMFLKDIFCGRGFIIVEIVRTSIEFPTMIKTIYHINSTDKKHKSIKVQDYTSSNYDTNVVSYKKEHLFDTSFVIDEKSGNVTYNYPKFKGLIDAIRNPYLELRENVGVDIDDILNK